MHTDDTDQSEGRASSLICVIRVIRGQISSHFCPAGWGVVGHLEWRGGSLTILSRRPRGAAGRARAHTSKQYARGRRRLRAGQSRTAHMKTATQDMGHLIRFIPAFRELDEPDLAALAKSLHQRAVRAGELVVKQG